MKLNSLTFSVLLSAVLLAATGGALGARESRRPNVIVINIDNHEKSALGYYGNKLSETPNIDRLAETGVRFESYHFASRCTASRAALMTGQYHLRTGCYGTMDASHLMKTGIPTMGDHFKKAGYRTGLFGKWHLGDTYLYRPEDRGFDEVVTYNLSAFPGKKTAMSHRFRHNREWKTYKGFRSTIWFRELRRFIREGAQEPGKPFLAYVATSSTQAPQAGPPELVKKYKTKLAAMNLAPL